MRIPEEALPEPFVPVGAGSTARWAEIGRLVGQRKLSITADTYTHVLSDGREADYAALFGRK